MAALLALSPAVAAAQATPAIDGPIATAAGHATPASVVPTGIQTTDNAAAPDDPGPVGPDRAPHGYIEVGAGTRGYRQVDGAVTVPVGDDGQATVEIGDVQGDGPRRR